LRFNDTDILISNIIYDGSNDDHDHDDIVMCIAIARQRLGKHITATNVQATIEYPLLGNGTENTVLSVR
jgi:hypothetical protein